MSDKPNGPLPPGGLPENVQQITIRIPSELVAPWAQLDIAQHMLFGVANLLQFVKQPELAGFIAGHAQAIAQKRDEIIHHATSRVQLAGPGDIPKG